MKFKILLFVLLAAAVPCFGRAQEKEQAAAPAKKAKEPAAYEQFMKDGMTRHEGVMPVYEDGKKYYLEIPDEMLGRELLTSGVIVQGPWNGTASEITDVWVFSRGANHRLEARKMIYADRIDASKADPGLVTALRSSSLQPVGFSYAIVAYSRDGKGCIIEVTKDVTAVGEMFSFPNLQWVNRPEASRSYLDSVVPIRRGVKFLSVHTQTDYMPPMFGGIGYDKHSTVLIEWSLQDVPRHEMRMRLADPRVGFATFSYNDYGTGVEGARKREAIRKWHLGVSRKDRDRYMKGQPVEPETPVIVYIDGTVPPSLRHAVREGILAWNSAFEAAGFRHAVRVVYGEPGSAFAPSQIVCSYAIILPRVYTVSDPRTGEILCGRITLSDKYISDAVEECLLRAGGAVPELFQVAGRKTAREEAARWFASKAMGSVLGLTPNAAGSMAYTVGQLRNPAFVRANGISASVLDDCMVNYVAQPGDRIPLRDLFSRVSHYDRWAVEWAYREFPANGDMFADRHSLKSHLDRAKNDPKLRYVASGRNDFRTAATVDLSSDRLAAAQMGIDNLKALIGRLPELSMKEDLRKDSWDTYTDWMSKLYMYYMHYASMALSYFGGEMRDPVIPGFNDVPVSYVPAKQQRQAMAFLDRYVCSGIPGWLRSEQLVGAKGDDGSEMMRNLMAKMAVRMTAPGTTAELLNIEKRMPGDAYSCDEMMRAVDQSVFLGFSADKPFSRHERLMQSVLVEKLTASVTNVKSWESPDEVSFTMLQWFKEIHANMKRLAVTHSDPDSRSHCRNLQLDMERRFTAAAAVAPAGIPIPKPDALAL